MSLATCSGMSGHFACGLCARYRPAGGLMRPTVRLTRCALFTPSKDADKGAAIRHGNGDRAVVYLRKEA